MDQPLSELASWPLPGADGDVADIHVALRAGAPAGLSYSTSAGLPQGFERVAERRLLQTM
ncbi:hypothetical protein AB0N93_36710 [Streptomyces sp. NPDC091267]|uniref:hypothetical protein n=1 Tax=Streptomyces sp. NPDC091267 TaxID=3155195 RepID=UPI00341E441C